MSGTIVINRDGKTHEATYQVSEDEVTVFLPNGETRSSQLRGLNAKSCAETHLKYYARTQVSSNRSIKRTGE